MRFFEVVPGFHRALLEMRRVRLGLFSPFIHGPDDVAERFPALGGSILDMQRESWKDFSGKNPASSSSLNRTMSVFGLIPFALDPRKIERRALSGFIDGHRIQYQNVFEKGCDIGPESTVPFTPEKWAPLSVSSPEKRKEFRSSSAGARQRCLKL